MKDSQVRTGYIGLGSNLASLAGEPVETLRAAIKKLGELVRLTAVSSFYATEPVGYPVSQMGHPPFVNGVVRVRTKMPPEDLMRWLLQIEREFGRDRAATMAKGPRTLDLDLLLVEDTILTTPLLTLPHPALATRRFVLAPLAELAPDLRHPVLGKTIVELLRALPSAGENGVDAVRMMQIVGK